MYNHILSSSNIVSILGDVEMTVIYATIGFAGTKEKRISGHEIRFNDQPQLIIL